MRYFVWKTSTVEHMKGACSKPCCIYHIDVYCVDAICELGAQVFDFATVFGYGAQSERISSESVTIIGLNWYTNTGYCILNSLSKQIPDWPEFTIQTPLNQSDFRLHGDC